jgi:hypothetical protein
MDIYEDLMSAFRQAIIHAFSKNVTKIYHLQ